MQSDRSWGADPPLGTGASPGLEARSQGLQNPSTQATDTSGGASAPADQSPN